MNDIVKIDDRLWSRKIINSVWIIILLEFIAASAAITFTFFTNPDIFMHDLIHRTLIPSACLVLINLIAELAWKFFKAIDYIMMLVFISIPATLILFLPMMQGIQNILFISILGTAFYFDHKKVVISCILTILTFGLLYMTIDTVRARINVYDIILTITVFICCMVLALGIVTRGMNLLQRLKQTMEDKQELHVQNILNDHLNKIDALTGLYNHKTFHEYMDRLIEQNQLNKFPLYLAMLDIDNFKHVNDTYGHWAGDILLKEVAATIKRQVTLNDPSFRAGGEEFAVLFIDHPADAVFRMVESIREEISEINVPELRGHRVTISIGLMRFEAGMDKYTWFNHTDNCLYHAKRTGKNKVVCELELQ
jgi:diguanylate cyclase (GGDEF)-like protein